MSPFTDLDVAFSDTRAGQLGFSLTAPQREPLATADHTIGSLTFSIRLLGASHQIVVTDDAHELCETVACLPDITTALPDSFQADGYVFSSRVIECSSDAMAEMVEQIESEVDGHARDGLPALLGRFPGNELAVTAVTADIYDDALVWRTWHTYPQAGEVVVTSSRMDRDALAVRP
ncbi:DUF2617 family protein [Gordonia sp. 852002-10350_SCH5691597]|uniref:DUF2617 family protein n=1 Tax=Gordonia sp. 852002-10350_SCH5691597 TaxID=1834085 RepID=UPI0007E9ABBC|nr:DUF2617 family protein [Gordonia sp. 852002-10350_SCH5691597]OBA68437.1 hypothetical protein A5777_01825 [Gordonia sp. 852002-10350_SCH5691597]